MLKVIHGADFHLDSPFTSLLPDKAATLRSEQKNLIYSLGTAIVSQKADVVLLAGDIFDSQNAFYDTVACLRDVFGDTKAQIFISPGNHDFWSEASPYTSVSWSPNVHIFKKNFVQRFNLNGLCVYGAGFTSRYQTAPMLKNLKHSSDDLAVGVFHGNFGVLNSQYNPISKEDIFDSGIHYIALGHIHEFSGLQKLGRTSFCYSGCLCGRGFDEIGDKGVVYCEISDDGSVSGKFVPLAKRRYSILSAKSEQKTVNDIATDIISQLSGHKNDIVRIEAELCNNDNISVDMLQRLLADYFFDVTLTTNKSERYDIWSLCGDNTLSGFYMSRLRRIYDEAVDEHEKACALEAAKLAFAAIKNINPQQEWEAAYDN